MIAARGVFPSACYFFYYGITDWIFLYFCLHFNLFYDKVITEVYYSGYYLFIVDILKFSRRSFIMISKQNSESQWQQKYLQEKEKYEQAKQEQDELLKERSAFIQNVEDRIKTLQEDFNNMNT